MKQLLLLLFLTSVRSAAISEIGKPPFREGIEYRYEWEARIESESPISTEKSSAARLRGQLFVVAKQEDSSYRALLKVRDVSLALSHGDRVEKPTSFVEVAHLNEQLNKPFLLLYSGSKIAGASFPDDNEQLWSVNFKRSIASLLQLELRDEHVYNSNELSLYGNCSVQYFTTHSTDNQYTIQKDRDLKSCSKNNGRWRTFIHSTSCPGSDKQPLLGTANSVRYSASINRGHSELFKVESIGSVVLDPFGVHKSSMKSTTHFTMSLEKTKRSNESLPSKQAFNDRLEFSFLRNEAAVPSSLSELKAAQNLMLHPEPLINDQENLRRKTQLDLIAAVDALSAESYSSDDRINVDKLALSAVSYQLGSLDYANARALYKELAIAPNNEKLHSAKNLFLDLILHSGSNAGIILLRDLIREQNLDAFTAARLVAYAGAFAKVPTEKLILEFQAVLDAQPSGKSDELGVYHNAAVLAVANLIGTACSGPVPCKIVKVEDLRKKYLDIVKSESSSYADRGLYLHALRNLGFGSALEAIMELATNNPALDDEPANDLRVYLINSLSAYKNQPKISKVLIRLLRDGKNSFRARIAAAQALLDDPIDDKTLDLMAIILNGDKNNQVRHYITSALTTIAQSRNPCTSQYQGKAKHILNTYGSKLPVHSPTNSAEYAFDFFENEAAFGSQLNLRTTNSEFDDMFGFVAGKMLYFIKGVAVQPFSFTVRTSGMRKYLSSFLSSSLKKEDLHSFRTQSSMDDFNFAPRRELGMGADVAFNLHGSTVMFYHFDKKFMQYAIGSARSFEILQDLNVNLQRYATTGALLYTQPNSLGLPVSVVMSAPILLSLKGSISKLKTPGVVGRRINLGFFGEIYGDHGLLTHLTPVNITQGVVRNRKAFFNIPLNLEVSGDLQKMQFDFTFVNPKATNPIELSSFARTILTIRPSESSYAIFRQACSQCRPVVVVQRKGAAVKTETIANLTLAYTGTDSHAQVFNCDGDRTIANQLVLVAGALNPTTINYRGYTSAWAYMSFIRLQHLTFIQPDGRHCGFRGRMHRAAHLPVKEISCRFKLRSNSNDDDEISWQAGKIGFKIECTWKGDASVSDRKGEVDFTYEYRNAGARNSVNVRAVAFRSPLLGQAKDVMICLKADGNFQPSPTDMIDISGYNQPPNAQGSIEYVMGEVNQINQRPKIELLVTDLGLLTNKCPTDQFRFKVNIKGAAGNWVIQRRDEAKVFPYSDCEEEKKSKNWAPGIVPQTDACYKAALDFTTLSQYQFDFRIASVPVQLQRVMGKLGDLASLSLLPYLSGEEGSPITAKDITQAQLNFTFLPEPLDETLLALNLNWSVNSVVERYSQISIPTNAIYLPSTSIPQSSRIAYESDIIPSCLVTSKYIRTLDKVQFNNNFSPCYSLVTTDCGSNPLFGVFVRKVEGLYPLAVKVQVGGHSIEILPDETGRRKHFTVRANELEVDALTNAFTLPEGRDKFYILKVRYQAPIYVISSPGAGLLVHYSGSHVAVFPTWLHKNQHCGLCGNFDGETDREWVSPQGCVLKDAKQLIASYTMGQTCYSSQEKNACPDGLE